MKLEKIKINNYRKFNNIQFEFSEGVNILIGDNASGKTSILEAIRIILGGFFYGINSRYTNSPSINNKRDVRYILNDKGQIEYIYPTRLEGEGKVFGKLIDWSRSLNTAKSSTTVSDLAKLKEIVSENDKNVLPIIVYYSVSRMKKSGKSVEYSRTERYIAYKDCLNASSSVSDFIKWFENEDRISYQNKSKTNSMKIVSEAIRSCLPDCKEVYYDSLNSDIAIKDANSEITLFSSMSEGYKLVTSLVGDLAYRCSVLNADLEEMCLKETSGVVLIDEIETHLHPSWQQTIIKKIKTVFPKIQFIISTHSPIVLSGVEGNVIRLNNDGSVEKGLSTYGRRADYIMYENQGVCTRDEKIQSEIDKFYRLLETKKGLKEAKEILENLFISKFGENDPDTRRAIRNYDFAFLEFEEEEE